MTASPERGQMGSKSAPRTWKQAERQKGRVSDGRYAKVNPCYACEKSAGVDYCSHPLTDRDGSDGENWNDTALVLCGKCASATEKFTTVSQFREYAAQVSK
jgi:hypothetical protein